jgi:hypothetical protein
MAASLVSTRHSSYHERHGYEMLAALRDLRWEALQAERAQQPNRTVAEYVKQQDFHRTRVELEHAIWALSERRYHQVYEQLRVASEEARAGGDARLADAIDEWREKWEPKNGRLNNGRRW